MTGFDHALVGGLIGRFLPFPVALPLAIASHFFLDSLPRYGLPNKDRDRSKIWRYVVIADFIATASLIVIPLPSHRYGMLICGISAVLPDFVWVIRLVKTRSFNMSHNKSRYAKWHAGIQHYERPWGIWVEAPLACVLLFLVLRSVS